MRRVLIALGLVAVLAYAGIVGLIYAVQRSLLFPADRARATPTEAGLPDFEEVALVTADGERLPAWYRPPAPGRAVLLYFHGNGGSLRRLAPRARLLAGDGTGLLLATYRGYSGATGAPSEEGLHRDAEAAHAWLARAVPAGRIVLYGESLGSGVAVRLASERPVGGLVLDAPFTSIADVARTLYWFLPVDRLLRDRFDSSSRIAGVKAPLLVLHGDADRVVPFALGERLFADAPGPKRFVRIAGGGHGGNLEGGLAEVRRFLRGVEGSPVSD